MTKKAIRIFEGWISNF